MIKEFCTWLCLVGKASAFAKHQCNMLSSAELKAVKYLLLENCMWATNSVRFDEAALSYACWRNPANVLNTTGQTYWWNEHSGDCFWVPGDLVLSAPWCPRHHQRRELVPLGLHFGTCQGYYVSATCIATTSCHQV